jgi:hypothetical protein
MRMILPRLIMRSIVGILRGAVPPHAQKIIDQVNTRVFETSARTRRPGDRRHRRTVWGPSQAQRSSI